MVLEKTWDIRKTDMLGNILLIDENVTGSKEEDYFMDPSSENVSDYLVDPNTSLPSYKPFSANILKTNFLAGSFDSISMIEPSEPGNEGNNDVRLYSVSEMQNHHTLFKRNLNQKTETKKASRNKRTSNKISDLDSVILKTNRKSRTVSTRSRSSSWGWGSFAQIFQQNSGADISKVEKKKSRKPKDKREKKSKNLINEEIISKSTATNRIRLKVKMGKQVIQSCLPDNENDIYKYPQPKFEFPKSEYPKVDFPKVEFPKLEFPKLTNSVGGRLEDEVFLNTEYQFCYEELDKNISGKINGISTCDEVEQFGLTLDSRSLDPGTSPDSEVINQTPEASISRKLPEDLVNSAGFFDHEEKTGDGSYYSSEASVSEVTGVSIEAPIDSPVSRVSNIPKGRKIPKSSKSKGSGSRPKGSQDKSVDKHKILENAVVDQMSCKVDSLLTETDAVVVGPDEVPGALLNQHVSQRNAWVRCDDCYKWRRIAAALADAIEETNCKWICKDNNDTEFADCSIPQEKSNSAINAELEISDASCEEDACNTRLNSKQSGQRKPKVPQNSSWKLVRSNMFLHRNRKAQTIDEIMVCHCKQSLNGRMGCGDGCLNRLLNIECVKGTCPCGELCSNQQFQKRKYAKLESFRCGKKGHGLRLLEDIPDGGFLIEYVGEVLDTHAYEARQKEYALNGHKHFYFMTLNGSEVIDACAKGNLGRFINHSCEPNCRTEKWMVNGEVCVGLFAMRDIKKGEEVTFDYNYVRVFGAAAKKCVCNSSQCRGYIGGDPNNNELIVQGDSDDEEYPEPVMIYEDGDRITKELSKPDIVSSEDRNQSIDFTIPVPHTELIGEYTKRECSILEPETFTETDQSVVPLEASRNSVAKQRLETTCSENTIEKSLPDIVEIKKPSSKSHARTKTARSSSSSIKKVKAKNHALGTSKPPELDAKPIVSESFKPKKMFDVPPNSTFEAVQVKLNELLDAEGGISRRKDASRGYLKLLFLTAASGDTGNSETIQSTRDLSMILDAILKTKSRSVLLDVINKNGAQMLHNIMKRYRREFKKIPILRKLLKILEFLASREILTLEHISRAPPCAGAESLRESILTLTEHNDRQVHQIARKFRDTFIPRSMRKVNCPERDFDRNMDHHQNSNNTRFSVPHRSDHSPKPTADPIVEPVKKIPTDNHNNNNTNSNDTINNANNTSSLCTTTVNNPPPRIRKRKSRWDEPGKPDKEPRIETPKSEPDSCQNSNPTPMDEDLPPGFFQSARPELDVVTGVPLESLTSDFPVSYGAPLSVGEPQKKYNAKFTVSYGIPLAVVQQFGSPNKEILGNWIVAPGTPFRPFPPLPTYPRQKKDPPAEISRGTHFSDPVTPSTSGAEPTAAPTDFSSRGSNNQHGFQHAPLGRKYFRQQKFNNNNNNPKFPPPWVRSRMNTGFIGSGENQHHQLPTQLPPQMPPQLPPPGFMGMEGPENCFYPPTGPMMPPRPMYHQHHHHQQQNWHY